MWMWESIMFNYDEFEKWVNEVLKNEFPENTVAINFNLYEEAEKDKYAIQITGTERFDEEDWACYESFSSGENLYVWLEEGDWEKALESAVNNLNRYLEQGTNSAILLKYSGVGVGFVDGDIEIIYRK